MNPPYRVVIVDDHVMLRDGIVSILHKEPDFDVVGETGSVAGAIDLVRSTMPDLVLMDYGLPDGNGLDATRQILDIAPDTNVVLLTVHEEDDLLYSAVRTGAKGYLLKYISANVLLNSLRALADGDFAMLPAERQRIMAEFARTSVPRESHDADATALTDREVEVLQLVGDGATNREIALQLHISLYTVKNHVHSILKKLSAPNRHEAVRVAARRGLISPRHH